MIRQAKVSRYIIQRDDPKNSSFSVFADFRALAKHRRNLQQTPKRSPRAGE